MGGYILKRLLLMVFTLWGIISVTFVVVQFAPGGPVEQTIAKLSGLGDGASDRLSGGGSDVGAGGGDSGGAGAQYRGAQGLDPEFIKELERLYGFDKPWYVRYGIMLRDYSTFDFGRSYFRDIEVIDLIWEKMPVSISLGIWLTVLSYLISIPLGIKKAISDGSSFDIWTSAVVIVGYAIPNFLFGLLLMILFAGGSFFDWFPLRGLLSEGLQGATCWPFSGEFDLKSCVFEVAPDYFWHITLPLISLVLGGFAITTLLTKNSFLDEIKKQYVTTARAKGLNERQVLYGHVFRNAMLIIVAGFPAAFIGAFFTGALLIEQIFSLDGLGLLGFESILNRDYPVVFATLFIFSLIGLFMNLISDLIYTWIDPRIDFERRDV